MRKGCAWHLKVANFLQSEENTLRCQAQPLRTKWTLDVKNWGKNCDFEVSIATLTHEMDVGRQKLKKNCDFEVSIVTNLSHEMDVGRQKLKKNCDFELSIATLSHEMDVGRQKLRKNCDFTWSIVTTLSHEMDVGRQKLRKNCDGRFRFCTSVCVKASVCKSVCV